MVLVRRFSKPPAERSSLRWFEGMLMASCFSFSYFVAPFYMLASIFVLLFNYPNRSMAWLFVSPIFVSALLPSTTMPWLLRLLHPMADYFDYEEIHETSPRDVWEEVKAKKSNFLIVKQPHGSLSYTGMMSAIMAPPEIQGIVPTAVADVLLVTPILKHVRKLILASNHPLLAAPFSHPTILLTLSNPLTYCAVGIFNLISASKKSMIKTLKKKGAEGTIVLYVGGMAELFLSSETEEKLYLKKRKGFIKLALTQGVDIVPVYLFGNTHVLSVLKTGILAVISRKLQASLTYIWGKWYLPIPRDCKLLYVTGQPLGLPTIAEPTQADIDKYHALYCQEVTRLFETYKENAGPNYKHKRLEIV
jgi:2-acylglycerol O-acyltransferase 2